MEKKLKHGTKEYWMDWYWNRGGREKVQARRYIREYERERQKDAKQVRILSTLQEFSEVRSNIEYQLLWFMAEQCDQD